MGEQQDIALDIIVRTGDEQLFSKFVSEYDIAESTKSRKHIETIIYSVIKGKGNFRSIRAQNDFNQIGRFLSEERFRDYFTSTNNVNIIKNLVDKFRAGAELYVDAVIGKKTTPHAVDLFGIKPISDAMRRNMERDYRLKKSIGQYVQSSYCAVLCRNNSELAENIDGYLTLLEPWQEFMDPLEVATKVIPTFVWLAEKITSEDHYPNFRTAVNKLIGLIDRPTISKLVFEAYTIGNKTVSGVYAKIYAKLIKDGVIDRYEPPETTEEAVLKAIEVYEKERSPYMQAVETLRKKVGEKGKEGISLKLAEWFEKGKMEHLQRIIEFGSDLYDEATVRRMLGNAIENAVKRNNLAKLDFTVNFLPENLMDKDNPTIQKYILPAYQVIHKEG